MYIHSPYLFVFRYNIILNVPWIYIWVGVTLFGRCMHLYSHAFFHTVFFGGYVFRKHVSYLFFHTISYSCTYTLFWHVHVHVPSSKDIILHSQYLVIECTTFKQYVIKNHTFVHTIHYMMHINMNCIMLRAHIGGGQRVTWVSHALARNTWGRARSHQQWLEVGFPKRS